MQDFSWLVSHSLVSATRREFDWVFEFDRGVAIVVSCLWRLLHDNRIGVTSQDDGHQFGLPAPVDATAILNQRLAGRVVERVEVQSQTLDLSLHFSGGLILQFVPDSSGYEAWILTTPIEQFIAAGGGEIFRV
jgi:hypothetical protein